MNREHIKEALRKASLQKERIEFECDETGATFTMVTQSDSTFAYITVPVSHNKLEEMVGEWLRSSCPLEMQRRLLDIVEEKLSRYRRDYEEE